MRPGEEKGGRPESSGRAAPGFPAKCSRRPASQACPWPEGPRPPRAPRPPRTRAATRTRTDTRTHSPLPGVRPSRREQVRKTKLGLRGGSSRGRLGTRPPRSPAPLPSRRAVSCPSLCSGREPNPRGGKGRRGRLGSGRCQRPPPGARAQASGRAGRGEPAGLPAESPSAAPGAPGRLSLYKKTPGP